MTRPDFPRTLAEFQDRFASEADCRRYLVACRWPDGFRCPRCGEPDAYGLAGRELLQCRSCRHQTSVTAGTVLHRRTSPSGSGSRRPTWSPPTRRGSRRSSSSASSASPGTRPPGRCCTSSGARCSARSGTASRAWSRSTRRTWAASRRGAGAAARQRQVHRRRRGRGARPGLGPRPARRRRGPLRGLAGAVRRGLGRSGQHGADGRLAGVRPAAQGLRPPAVDGGGPEERVQAVPARPPTFSNLKTWLQGTHHGVGAKHLPPHVDEFVFRFNRRRTPMAAFQSLLGLSTRHAPTTHKMLYAAEPTG